MKDLFRALRVRNFRLWFFGVMSSYLGSWIVITTLSWVTLTALSDGDAFVSAVATMLVFAPSVVLVGVAGLVIDRSDRRRLLLATHLSMAIISSTLAILLLFGLGSIPVVYLLALVLGLTVAFDQPARHSFIVDLVPMGLLQNAVALNVTSYNTARLVGPAAAGLLMVLLDPGIVFLVGTVMFLVAIVALRLMRATEFQPRHTVAGDRSVFGGFAYLAHHRPLVIVTMVALPVAMFVMNFPLIGSTMALHFGEGSDGFGLLSSFFAVGAIGGALLAARRQAPQLGLVLVGGLGTAVTIGLSGFMPTYLGFGLVLVLLGISSSTLFATASAIVQFSTVAHMRGRVTAIYLALTAGAGPIAAPVLGGVINTWGAPAGPRVISALILVFTVIGWLWSRAGVTPEGHST